MDSNLVTDVAAAVLLRRADDGGTQYMLAQRPPGKVYAGYWEFPGGKLESGESGEQALARELNEEMGIVIERAWPWLCCEFVYPHARVRLKFFRVTAWRGEISLLEHSALCWTTIGALPSASPVLPANGPILRALELPSIYALTNAVDNGIASELSRLEKALAGGLRLIQIRDKLLPEADRLHLARGAMALAGRYPDAIVLVGDDEALALEVGAHGVHLSSTRLKAASERPAFAWVGASCHGAEELARAAALGVDFALLSPVLPTASHPHAPTLGWREFARLTALSQIPVFALGGMRPELLETACAYNAHGIAMLRGWA